MKKRNFFRKCMAICLVVIMLLVPTLSCASMFYTPDFTDYMKGNITDYGSMIGSNNGFNYGGTLGSNSGFGTSSQIGTNDGFGYGSMVGTDTGFGTGSMNGFGSGFSNYNKSDYSEYYSNKNFSEIFNKIDELEAEKEETLNKQNDSLNDVKALLQNVDPDLPISDSKVEIIDKVTQIRDNNKESDLTNKVSNIIINEAIAANPNGTTSDLLTSIKGGLGNLIGGGVSLTSLEPDLVVKDMVATTAGKKAGNEFKVKLAGKIYFANKDRKGNPTSDKWVVLVHGFMMNGQAIADALGEMYLKQGINVLAPDLRGFGDSEGSVAMGYLESLDVWDWLTYLNKNYNCEEIFIHGVSLGGATTVFISGLEVDGKTMADQNVIGLIEDCGYASMTGIITDMISFGQGENILTELAGGLIKTYIIDGVGVGLNENNFDELQNALNSLKNSTLPLLIVHGTGDTTVPSSNSDKIYDVAMKNQNIPYVQKYLAKGGQHAFITLGMNAGEYEAHLNHFIDVAEDIAAGKTVKKEGNFSPTKVEDTSILGVIISTVKLMKNLIF